MKNVSQFSEVLLTIKNAQKKVYRQLNSSLIELYWDLGKYITQKVETEKWGKSVVEDLSVYIKSNEPNSKGFSTRNLWKMKQFYQTYKNNPKLSALGAELSWTHNRRIMSLKTENEREFYLTLCAKNKYSVRELERIINTGTYERTMLAKEKMPKLIKQLPKGSENIFKDSYVFEFLDLPLPYAEKDLQTALATSLKDFILKLGTGFSFIGQEFRIQVGSSDFYIDLLFFHRELQALVTVKK